MKYCFQFTAIRSFIVRKINSMSYPPWCTFHYFVDSVFTCTLQVPEMITYILLNTLGWKLYQPTFTHWQFLPDDVITVIAGYLLIERTLNDKRVEIDQYPPIRIWCFDISGRRRKGVSLNWIGLRVHGNVMCPVPNFEKLYIIYIPEKHIHIGDIWKP